MYTGKMDHRFTDNVSLNGFYLYNKTNEPCANYFEPGLEGPNRFVDSRDYILRRRVHLLTLNNTWLPGNNTVLTFRYGMNTFNDNNTMSIDFDPATLGFPSSFVNSLQQKKFPYVQFTDYGQGGTRRLMGAIDPVNVKWHSWAANGALSKLIGQHTIKIGVDYRFIGLDFQSFDEASGNFLFTRHFTSSDPAQNGTGGTTPSGNAFASFLLGYPSGDPGNLSRVGKSNPVNVFTNYFGFYAQDDYRVNPKLTLNYGVRLEHEQGLQEKNNNFTVAFDQTLNPGGALGNVVNPVTGQRIVGGLVYAGQNGANEYQGDPPTMKLSPRVGLVYAMNPKTVVRAGFGTYWSPWNYQAPSNVNYGQIGAARQTFINQGQFYPTVNLNNPFPGGLLDPVGNALGALTGVGGEIRFIDQNKRAPHVYMYSADFNREIGGGFAVGFEYSGATGRDLGLGGANEGLININQVPVQHWALGATALNAERAQSVLRTARGPGLQRHERDDSRTASCCVRSRSSATSCSCRPPRDATSITPAILKLEKRVTNGWGGRINYTYSRLEDNQYGESNVFSLNSTEAANNYDLDAEYAIGLLDVPHKLVFSPIVELPFGEGKKWLQSGVGAAILGNWTLSSIISFESGFPFSPNANSNDLSGLGVRMQRANPGTGDADTDGSRDERIAGNWFNSAAFVDPVGIVQGTLPRNLSDVRTPHRNNWDFVATKAIPIGGRARAEVRLEVLNITNTVKVFGPTQTIGSASFGQARSQSGFMRLTQLAFRVNF